MLLSWQQNHKLWNESLTYQFKEDVDTLHDLIDNFNKKVLLSLINI